MEWMVLTFMNDIVDNEKGKPEVRTLILFIPFSFIQHRDCLRHRMDERREKVENATLFIIQRCDIQIRDRSEAVHRNQYSPLQTCKIHYLYNSTASKSNKPRSLSTQVPVAVH